MVHNVKHAALVNWNGIIKVLYIQYMYTQFKIGGKTTAHVATRFISNCTFPKAGSSLSECFKKLSTSKLALPSIRL